MIETILLAFLAMMIGVILVDHAYRLRVLIPPDPYPDRDDRGRPSQKSGRKKKRRRDDHDGHDRQPYQGTNGNGNGQPPRNGEGRGLDRFQTL